MGSVVDPALPVIDLSNETLNLGSPAWPSTCHQVRIALEEYGCFIAMYHQEPLEHLTFFQGLKDLFDRPIHTKSQNISILPYHGYIGMQSILGLHESMGIERATTLDGVQKFTNLMFPAGNDSFSESIHTFSKIVGELDDIVTRMIFDSYGVSRYYERHVEDMGYLIRMMKYRVPDLDETDVGFTPHTDKNFTTILYQNQIDGLEIETKSGKWISVELSPSSFIVIAGDAIMAWSNGRIESPNHKVTMKNKVCTRYSLGLFTFSNGEIRTPDELVDEEHPLQFEPFEHLGYLRAFYAYQGPKSECPLKSYCGVN
ncbi:hypothetical protein QQ045_007951 [Rhodiola kirilowii]